MESETERSTRLVRAGEGMFQIITCRTDLVPRVSALSKREERKLWKRDRFQMPKSYSYSISYNRIRRQLRSFFLCRETSASNPIYLKVLNIGVPCLSVSP